jgi:hypothetical protein
MMEETFLLISLSMATVCLPYTNVILMDITLDTEEREE